jgi:anti-sigma-K factor RskA
MTAEADHHYVNRELAIGWALHALEPDDEAIFARHLPSCEECMAEVEATEDMAVLFATDVDQYDPPAHLRAAVLNATSSPQVPRQNQPSGMGQRGLEPQKHARAALRHQSTRGWQSTRRFTSSRKMLLAAAAVVVLGFGAAAGWVASNVFSTRGTSSVSALEDQNVLTALTDPAVRKVILTEKDSTAPMALLLAGPKDTMVMPMNMPSAASNTQYVVWGVPSATGAKPVALGGVAGNGETHGALKVSATGTSAPASFTGFAMSVEPAGAVPASPTTIVAEGHV